MTGTSHASFIYIFVIYDFFNQPLRNFLATKHAGQLYLRDLFWRLVHSLSEISVWTGDYCNHSSYFNPIPGIVLLWGCWFQRLLRGSKFVQNQFLILYLDSQNDVLSFDIQLFDLWLRFARVELIFSPKIWMYLSVCDSQ